MLGLVAHAAGLYGDRQRAVPRVTGGLAPWQERRAKAMLDADHRDAPSLAAIAAASGISVAHFSRAFRRSVGTSPWAWRQARQIERAQTLLRDPSLTLTEVAYATGFADQSHFTRSFTKRQGVSPGQWRRERGLA